MAGPKKGYDLLFFSNDAAWPSESPPAFCVHLWRYSAGRAASVEGLTVIFQVTTPAC